jgi:hypothetical protein
VEGLEGVIAAMELRRKNPPAASAPAPPAAPAAPAAPRKPENAGPRQAAAAGPLQAMFEDGNSLLKAIVASEIVGTPIALRDGQGYPLWEHRNWNLSPNEP